jgi:hypothetical protein
VWVGRLEPDVPAAHTVTWIFWWRVRAQLDAAAIARRLNSDPVACPVSPSTGVPRRWSRRSVTAVLVNPVYTGRQIWGRTAAGRAVAPERWIVSAPGAHPALITDQVFLAAQPDHADRAALARVLGITDTTTETLPVRDWGDITRRAL